MSARKGGVHDEKSRKNYPKTCRYTFQDGDSTVSFGFEWRQVLEDRDVYGASAEEDKYGMSSAEDRKRYDQMGIQPTDLRYYATGTLTIANDDGTITETGDMIYELNYPASRTHL